MSDVNPKRSATVAQTFSSHIPIPYGCLGVIAVVLGLLTVGAVSSLAVAMVITR